MVVMISVSHLLAKITLNWSHTRLEQSSLAKQYGGHGRAQTLIEQNHDGKMGVFRLRHLDDHKAGHQHSYGKVSSNCIHYFAAVERFTFHHPIVVTSLLKNQTSKATLLETNISPKKSILMMIFLFPRWDMLVL